MTDDKRCFVDTNVFLAATDRDRPDHTHAIDFLESGLRGEARLFANGQVFREYLVVATRPVPDNGLGLTASDALSNLQAFAQGVQLLEENQAVSRQLQRLVEKFEVSGKRIHDANIVATMRENGLAQLKTFNQDDFSDFPDIDFA
ncbi:MAG: type II toxin-antitoxin system VapC family toxin [Verrucomicrobiota bacterium]